MKNMQIKNLLLIFIFMSAQLLCAEERFGVNKVPLCQGMVMLAACGVVGFLAHHHIMKVRNVRSEIVRVTPILLPGNSLGGSSRGSDGGGGGEGEKKEDVEVDGILGNSRQGPGPEQILTAKQRQCFFDTVRNTPMEASVLKEELRKKYAEVYSGDLNFVSWYKNVFRTIKKGVLLWDGQSAPKELASEQINFIIKNALLGEDEASRVSIEDLPSLVKGAN